MRSYFHSSLDILAVKAMLLLSNASYSSVSGSECDVCIGAIGTTAGRSIVAATRSFVREGDEEIEKEEVDFVVTPERGRAVVRMNDCIPRQKVAAVRRRNAVVTKTPLGCIVTVAHIDDEF